jgi:hypothetical protein
VEPPVLSSASEMKICSNAARTTGAASTASIGSESPSLPHKARQRATFGNTSAQGYGRSGPAITTSWISPPPAATMRVRSGPTLTQVPVESLKSSASRPSNMTPRARSAGSTKRMASPSL